MSPNQLADELGISPKTLRAWLRREYPRDTAAKWSSWELTIDQIAAARARWGGQTQEAPLPGRAAPRLRSGCRETRLM